MFDINYYELPDGEKPVETFLASLNPDMRAKAFHSLELLEEFGNNLRKPYSRHIEDGIFELRIKFASDITRIFYFFVVNNEIVLTNGFIKKTLKTPRNQIKLAKKYKTDFERRREHERL